jgi:glucosyl-3-phosphoglycerate synthase
MRREFRAPRSFPLAGVPRLREPSWPRIPEDPRVSVVIPVLNESARISSVVRFAKHSPLVAEVIVIDDGSIDETSDLAREAGAVVITSTLLGKGASMQDGLRAARHDVLLYLDGDLSGLRPDLVERMCRPVVEGRADFVKASFSRRAGRVTTLTARPLIRTYFPEVSHFDQPLAGVVAARRELLSRLDFEDDFGVDVGLLLDAAASGARIEQAYIGQIEHDRSDLDALGEMAAQVARAILSRAAAYGRLRLSFIRHSQERDRIRRAHPEQLLSRFEGTSRLALLDMDGTLLDGRFIVELARRCGRSEALSRYLDRTDVTPAHRTRRIAAAFKGVPRERFEEVARELPLIPGAVETVVGLRKRGYCVAVVTDGFHVAAEIVRRRVFADFALANVMEFRRGSATGIVTLSPAPAERRGPRAYDKLNTLRFLIRRLGLKARDVLAVGDGDNDVGMLRAAGLSVAFQPKSERVRRAARHVVTGRLDGLLRLLPD